MQGFLSDGVRDALATFGFAIAILQTWLAIRSVRRVAASEDAVTPAAKSGDEARRREGRAVVGCVATSLVITFGVPVMLAYLAANGYIESNTRIWVVVARCLIAVGTAFLVAIGYNYHLEASIAKSRLRRVALLVTVHGGAVGLLVTASSLLLWAANQNHDRLDVAIAETFAFVVVGVALVLPVVLLQERFGYF